MDESPLPGLTPGDPQNRLTPDARRRVQRAHLKAEEIKWEAEVKIETRNLASNQPTAVSIRKRANLKAARSVLQVLSGEYGKLALPLAEFRECMRQEIESATNSLGLSSAEQHLLGLKFLFPPAAPKIKQESRPSIVQSQTRKTHETVGAQINRLRNECNWTIEELAEKISVNVRTIQRHLADESKPYKRHISAYQRVISKRLNRQVVIKKMP